MKIKAYILLLFIYFSASSCALPNAINNNSLLSSPVCKKYTCVSYFKDVKNNIYIYKIINKKTLESYQTYIWSDSKIKNNIAIYLSPGTLYHDPSFEFFDFFHLLVQWSTGVNLNYKADLYGSTQDVERTRVDAVSLANGKIGSTPITIFIKSNPDTSLDPKKGQLVYGIIDTKAFPPLR